MNLPSRPREGDLPVKEYQSLISCDGFAYGRHLRSAISTANGYTFYMQYERMCRGSEFTRKLVLSAIIHLKQAERSNVVPPEKLDAALMLTKNIHYC